MVQPAHYLLISKDEQHRTFGPFAGPAFAPRDTREQVDLARRATRGNEDARDLLITSNVPFALWYAKRYHGYGSKEDIDMLAVQGLVKGVDRYEWQKGVKPISYLVHWIRQSIIEGLAYEKNIRRPTNQVLADVRVRRAQERAARTGSTLSLEEACRALGESPALVRAARDAGQEPLRLDASPKKPHERTYELPAVENGFDLEHASRVTYLGRLLETSGLNEQEQRIVHEYFGLQDGHGSTLEEIGDQLGVTRQRIQQIKENALRKMRMRAQALTEDAETRWRARNS